MLGASDLDRTNRKMGFRGNEASGHIRPPARPGAASWPHPPDSSLTDGHKQWVLRACKLLSVSISK